MPSNIVLTHVFATAEMICRTQLRHSARADTISAVQFYANHPPYRN